MLIIINLPFMDGKLTFLSARLSPAALFCIRDCKPIPNWIYDGLGLAGVLYQTAALHYHCIMKLYEALSEMRRLTATGQTFSMSFMSWSETTRRSEGVVEVPVAKLRKRSRSERVRNANILIAYHDCSRNEARQFYLPLLMSFNGQKTTIR